MHAFLSFAPICELFSFIYLNWFIIQLLWKTLECTFAILSFVKANRGQGKFLLTLNIDAHIFRSLLLWLFLNYRVKFDLSNCLTIMRSDWRNIYIIYLFSLKVMIFFFNFMIKTNEVKFCIEFSSVLSLMFLIFFVILDLNIMEEMNFYFFFFYQF